MTQTMSKNETPNQCVMMIYDRPSGSHIKHFLHLQVSPEEVFSKIDAAGFTPSPPPGWGFTVLVLEGWDAKEWTTDEKTSHRTWLFVETENDGTESFDELEMGHAETFDKIMKLFKEDVDHSVVEFFDFDKMWDELDE